ncbi:MAG: hypothetical protein ABIH00_03250 [Armatimonadota bacterium]
MPDPITSSANTPAGAVRYYKKNHRILETDQIVKDNNIKGFAQQFYTGFLMHFKIDPNKPNSMGDITDGRLYAGTMEKGIVKTYELVFFNVCNLDNSNMEKFIEEFSEKNPEHKISLTEIFNEQQKDGGAEKSYRFIIE